MKLKTNEKSEIFRTGDVQKERQSFGLLANAKTFKILSSSIYKYKERAIIRELSTNAIDGHILAGHTKNFDVQLPTELDPRFIVRDYGTGLSEDEMYAIYRVYFASTKTHSNDFIGALGLGSKSPFSYTDTFTVESIQNGVKSGYVAYMENGEPFLDKLYSEDTTEPNGVSVTIPVKHGDSTTWRKEAKRVYEPFGDIRPNFIGEDFSINYQPTKTDHNGMIVYSSKHYPNGAYAKMGNIMYPIDSSFFEGTLFSIFMQDKVYVIPFEMGSLDFMPSREELSLDKSTKALINEKISASSSGWKVKLKEMLDERKTIRDKISFYNSASISLKHYIDHNTEFHYEGNPFSFYYKNFVVIKNAMGTYSQIPGFWSGIYGTRRCNFEEILHGKSTTQRRLCAKELLLPWYNQKIIFVHMDLQGSMSKVLGGYHQLNGKQNKPTLFVEYNGDKNSHIVQNLVEHGFYDESEVIFLKASEMKAEMLAYQEEEKRYHSYPSEKRPKTPNVYKYTLASGIRRVEPICMLKSEFVKLTGYAFAVHGVDDYRNLKNETGNVVGFRQDKELDVFGILGTDTYYIVRANTLKWIPETGLVCADDAISKIFIGLVKSMKINQYNNTQSAVIWQIFTRSRVDLSVLVGNNTKDPDFIKACHIKKYVYPSNDNELTKAVKMFETKQSTMNTKYRTAKDEFAKLNPAIYAYFDLMDSRYNATSSLTDDVIENLQKIINWK